MTLLERELRKLSDDELQAVIARGVPEAAAVAQAELDSRPARPVDDGEAWIRKVFPQRPSL